MEAAKDWHETRLLAEGEFTGTREHHLEQHYERAETELFAPNGGTGREIGNTAMADDSKGLTGRGEKEGANASAAYGFAAHRQAFAAALVGTATEAGAGTPRRCSQ